MDLKVKFMGFIILTAIAACGPRIKILDIDPSGQAFIRAKSAWFAPDNSNIDYREPIRLYLVNNGVLSPIPGHDHVSYGKRFTEYMTCEPMLPGHTYAAVYKKAYKEIRVPAPKTKPDGMSFHVLDHFPKDTLLPVNTLQFFIKFSRPLVPELDAFKWVCLKEEGKKECISRCWREKSYFLDNDSTLVLMIHPGRVKRSIRVTQDLGPVLSEGKRYCLTVGTGLKSQETQVFDTRWRYCFTTGPMDTVIPALIGPDFSAIKKGETSPIYLNFSEKMNYGEMVDAIKVFHGTREIPGRLETSDTQHWIFYPKHPWVAGQYRMDILNSVCDQVNNSLVRPFEATSVDQLVPIVPIPYPFTVE